MASILQMRAFWMRLSITNKTYAIDKKRCSFYGEEARKDENDIFWEFWPIFLYFYGGNTFPYNGNI